MDAVKPGDSQTTLVQLLNTVLTNFMNSVKPPEPKNDLVRTITLLKEAGILTPPAKTDEAVVLEKLRLMKEALGLKYAHEAESDPMEEIEEFQDLVEAIRPWFPKAPKPSVAPFVIEAVARFGLPAFNIFKNLVALNRLNALYRLATMSPPAQMKTMEKKGEATEGKDETTMDKEAIDSNMYPDGIW